MTTTEAILYFLAAVALVFVIGTGWDNPRR